MSKIKVMDENLANKIAAGEVVEKCSSIVKELVENAIDADANNIKIDLIDGGIKKISVIDNGVGMDEEDAVLAFSRHATSKIMTDNDLFFIETLGFRGEALASIASVSEVSLDTCNDEVGTHVHIKGGKLLEVSKTSAKKGSSITVSNLFYNTPARLKYLKSEVTEANNCISLIEKLALSHPEIAFCLTNNEKVTIKTTGSNNLLKTIHEIYGFNVSNNMLELNTSNDDFIINGFISKPSVLKKNRNHFHIMINNRVIRNNEINRCINDAYNTYKHDGFYPIVVINILVDPTLVDVNIHPTKQDVKLSKISDLTELLYNEIKEVLYNNLLIPEFVSNEEVKEEEKIKEVFEEKEIIQKSFDFDTSTETIKNKEIKKLYLEPVAQVLKTYIVAQNEDGIFLIDQHAAHERVNYEMILKKFSEDEVHITDLLVPITIELSTSEYNTFNENKEVLSNLGFKIEEFGINTIIIKSHPTWLKSGFEEQNIKSIVDLIITEGKKFNKDKFLDSMAKMVSCKMSVKAGDHLSIMEMEELLNDLVLCDNPYNCCHGRPSIVKYSKYELERMFKRVM